ncbi:hypothetical protein [Bacteroides sp.]
MIISEIIDLFSDERLLEKRAVSDEYFNLLNVISLINNEDNCCLFQVEMGLISLYEVIKDNSDLNIYICELDYVLRRSISGDDIENLKSLLVRMEKDFRANLNLSNEILVKKIR